MKRASRDRATGLVPDGGDLPNGIYRVEYTDEYLRSWGLTDDTFQHGIWTYRLEDGHWTVDQVADDITSQVKGIYRVGRDLYWRWDNGQPVEHLRWAADDRGDLSFAPAPGTRADLESRSKHGRPRLDLRPAIDPSRPLGLTICGCCPDVAGTVAAGDRAPMIAALCQPS